jgi:hypothetical protein
MVTPLHLAHLDPLVSHNSLGQGTLDKKDLLWHLNLPWVFALLAHTNTSSVERHGTCHAHQATVVATPIGKLLLQNLKWSNEPWCKLASNLEMMQTSHR